MFFWELGERDGGLRGVEGEAPNFYSSRALISFRLGENVCMVNGGFYNTLSYVVWPLAYL